MIYFRHIIRKFEQNIEIVCIRFINLFNSYSDVDYNVDR